ncbi:MAG: NAD(P)/FAD-dependent oxidoreductase [Myxococcales bacterium]|jgi:2-polyprenyl-6-methoxyphenol hydroxylase-like FAD-dependent oxidoreductase
MAIRTIKDTYDVIIVGARCAGAATAMLLAACGLRVLVFDKSRYGSDTLSTHALMRPAVLLLHRWGLTDRLEEEATPPIHKTSFIYTDGGGSEAIDMDIKPRRGVDSLYAPRRTVLDRILVDAARDAGAEVRHGVQMLELLRDGRQRVSGVRLRDEQGQVREARSALVIGADGRRSGVARLVGSRAYVLGSHMSRCAYGYFRNLPVGGNRWYYRPGMGAGAIPTNGEETCIFASVSEGFASGGGAARIRSFREVIERVAPDIGAALSGAELVGKLHFFPGMRGYLRQPWGDGWALVGDAGYMTDPITAHGITNALRDAQLLAHTIAGGNGLADYQGARDDLSLQFFELSDRIASFDWDIPTVQQYHRMMSHEMSREEEVLSSLGKALPLSAA